MRSNYLLYPGAMEKIKESGIEKKVQEFKQFGKGLPYLAGFVHSDEVFQAVQNLRRMGYYKHIPADFAEKYIPILRGMFQNPEGYSWKIQKLGNNKPENTIAEPCCLGDMRLFSGDLASLVLSQKELWDYARFGFSSPSAFVTTVGAFIFQQSKDSLPSHEGYKWSSQRADGSTVVTEITGDMHADLRIFQKDITNYPTVDPFGEAIEIRPETDFDQKVLAAYHSTESTLLVAVLKYVEQQKLEVKFLDSNKVLANVTSLLESVSGKPNFGTCAEHFDGFDRDPRLSFTGYEHPIPTLNPANQSSGYSYFWLPTSGEGGYKVYVAHNGDLVLSSEPSNPVEDLVNIKPISMRFPPEDAEHLLKGLIYQAAKKLGRTSVRQLLSILEYRYSPQFEEDLKKYG